MRSIEQYLIDTRGRFVEQKLTLSSSFRCDQIHNRFWSHFVVLDLDVQQTHLSAGKQLPHGKCLINTGVENEQHLNIDWNFDYQM